MALAMPIEIKIPIMKLECEWLLAVIDNQLSVELTDHLTGFGLEVIHTARHHKMQIKNLLVGKLAIDLVILARPGSTAKGFVGFIDKPVEALSNYEEQSLRWARLKQLYPHFRLWAYSMSHPMTTTVMLENATLERKAPSWLSQRA